MCARGRRFVTSPQERRRALCCGRRGGLGGGRRLAGERLDNRLDQSAWEEAEQDRPGGGDQ